MKSSELSDALRTEINRFAVGIGIGAVIYVVCGLFSLFYLGTASFDSLVAFTIRAITHAVVAAILLVAIILFVDYHTPGDWFTKIGEDPRSASYVTCSLILGTVYLLCYG